jgi:serine protease Do
MGLQETMKGYQAEDRVELSIVRDEQNKKIRLTLGERDKISPLNIRSNTQNNMGSVLSKRRKNFPNAFQHDAMLTSKAFGGPVVGLDGRVVGINIARAGRVANFSLPTHTILPIISELKSGKLAPELVNRQRIIEIDSELAEISKKLAELPEKKIDLELRYKVEQAKKIELEKMLKEIEDRLESVNEDHDKYKSEFYSARDDLEKLEKDRQKLKETRTKLATGVGSDSGEKR